MAKMLLLESKNTGEQFRLVLGPVKKDMQLPEGEQQKMLAERVAKVSEKIEAHLDEHTEDEIVVKGIGRVD